MRKLFLLRGAPGSGKSSFISRHHLQPYAISQDEIRLLFRNLTYSFDEPSQQLHHIITQDANVDTKELVNRLVEGKMSRGETVIVDGTHVAPGSIERYQPLAEKYHYELFVVDLMEHNTLPGLLARNEIRVKYHWVKPDVIKQMYKWYVENPGVPDGTIRLTANTMDNALAQRERNLVKYNNVYAIPDGVAATNFPGVHISNFYFSFNNEFSKKFGTYRNVINLAKTEEELLKEYKLPFFVFKFHNKHFLISAKPLRNEMIGPIKKEKGVWTYNTGLVNLLDFMKDFPQNEKQNVHQFNLSKMRRDQVLKIW